MRHVTSRDRISQSLGSSMSVASTFVGTPLYLSPECCEGKDYGAKADVWSLGAVLHELCALKPPFVAPAMPALVLKVRSRDLHAYTHACVT